MLLCSTGLLAQEFSILFTNSANGTYENCLCPNLPLGGLDKRVQFIQSYREQDPQVLVLDNGDNFIDYLSPEVEEVITAAFRLAGYDLINPGDQDIAYGTDGYFELEVLAAADAGPVTVVKGNQAFSILPILHPGTTRFYPKVIFKNLDLAGYEDRINRWLETKLPPGTFRVLLSHSGLETDMQLARNHPGIDLIVGGHSQTVLDTAVVIDGTPIVQAGGDAGYVGEIRFSRGAGTFNIQKHQLHPLDLDMPSHPQITKLVDKYHLSH